MLIVPDRLIDPADQLAMDEALLVLAEQQAEADGTACEYIRIWEFAAPVVVVGRSSRVREEVDVAFCEAEKIPIFRRCSGGAAIVGGPGCLMYSVILDCNLHPELNRIDAAHQFVMQRMLKAVNSQLADAQYQGTCDLTFAGRKFSGNSMRKARQHVLYHGTVLYQADLERIARCLRIAPRQPDYRAGRSHEQFITNVPIDPLRLERDLHAQFGSVGRCSKAFPTALIRRLRSERYDKELWNFKR